MNKYDLKLTKKMYLKHLKVNPVIIGNTCINI